MRIGERDQHFAPIFEMHVILVAEVLDAVHPADDAAAVRLRNLQVLGADADRVGAGRHRGLGNELRGKEIDLRRAEPAGDVAIARILVDLPRRAELKQLAVLDDADSRGHRHGLDLIVGHVQDRRAELDLNPLQLQPQLGAQLGVERRQRLVHQIDGGIAHQSPPDRDPLHFAAGQARRPIPELAGDVQQLRRLLDALADDRLRERDAPASAAGTRDCRKRSGADRANIAERRKRCRAFPADRCVTSRPSIEIEPSIGTLEAGNQSQRRRLAGAARPQQHDKLAIIDGEATGRGPLRCGRNAC